MRRTSARLRRARSAKARFGAPWNCSTTTRSPSSRRSDALLDGLPTPTPHSVLALGEALAGETRDASYELALETIDAMGVGARFTRRAGSRRRAALHP